MAARRSLKGRALQWLAQREQSRAELRRRLLRLARAEDPARADGDELAGQNAAASPEPADRSATPEERVEALLDWLEANRYLSAERFVESRVHAREARFGNLRIGLELKQHRLTMPVETAAALRATEVARARAVLTRKFGSDAPADAAARAKRSRFLAGRGFSSEAIGRALRTPSTHGVDPEGDEAA